MAEQSGPRLAEPYESAEAPEHQTIGIDLGTTNSLAAVLGPDGPRVLPNELGRVLVPSIVAVDGEGVVLVGEPARERSKRGGEANAARFKRDMGTGARYRLGTHELGPVELSALVLQEVKASAEAALGHPVRRVVITVPAYFKETQRSATMEAAAMAGLDVVRIINEPTAAAMAYGLHDSERSRKCIVLDLGGGTFDVSVVEVFEGVVEVVASTGDGRLGGEDFTDALFAHMLSEYAGNASGSGIAAGTLALLRDACETAKRTLSDHEIARLPLPDLKAPGFRVVDHIEVSRALLDGLNARRIERVRACVLAALRQCGCAPADIDEVVFAGGATRMRFMVDLVRELFGKSPVEGIHPDHVVACGAAVQAGLIDRHAAVDDIVVTDVTPFSLGIEIVRESRGRIMGGYFAPVIHRNTTVPTSRVESFSTLHPTQKELEINVFQGEHRHVDQNTLLGRLTVKGIPPAERGQNGQRVDVRLTLDVNGLLEVEATVPATGKKVAVLIEREGSRLGPAEKAAAQDAMRRLKVLPRDLLPNRFALEKAQSVFESLPRPLQEELDPVIVAFEAALDRQDKGEIELMRCELLAVLECIETQVS